MRRWLQMLAMVWMSAALLARPAGAHPHEGADWDSIAAQARALGSLPDATPKPASRRDAHGRAAQVSSLLCTVLPVAAGFVMQNEVGAVLGIGGVALGPSVGYFVGGHPARGVKGALGRTTLAVLESGLFTVVAIQGLNYGNDDEALGAVIAGSVVGAVLVGSAIYDIATVHATVDRHAAAIPRYRLQGMRSPSSGAPALALTIRF